MLTPLFWIDIVPPIIINDLVHTSRSKLKMVGECLVTRVYNPIGIPVRALYHSILASLYRARLHKEYFPNVPVQILKPMRIHKAVILRFAVGGSARGDRLADHLVDLLPVLQ